MSYHTNIVDAVREAAKLATPIFEHFEWTWYNTHPDPPTLPEVKGHLKSALSTFLRGGEAVRSGRFGIYRERGGPGNDQARIVLELSSFSLDENTNTLERSIRHGINAGVLEAGRIAEENGWNEDRRSIPEDLALMHSELSEALEGYREGGSMHPSDKLDDHNSLEEELADVIIRILHTADRLGLDLAGALIEKMRYNQTREHRHGGKRL